MSNAINKSNMFVQNNIILDQKDFELISYLINSCRKSLADLIAETYLNKNDNEILKKNNKSFVRICEYYKNFKSMSYLEYFALNHKNAIWQQMVKLEKIILFMCEFLKTDSTTISVNFEKESLIKSEAQPMEIQKLVMSYDFGKNKSPNMKDIESEIQKYNDKISYLEKNSQNFKSHIELYKFLKRICEEGLEIEKRLVRDNIKQPRLADAIKQGTIACLSDLKQYDEHLDKLNNEKEESNESCLNIGIKI